MEQNALQELPPKVCKANRNSSDSGIDSEEDEDERPDIVQRVTKLEKLVRKLYSNFDSKKISKSKKILSHRKDRRKYIDKSYSHENTEENGDTKELLDNQDECSEPNISYKKCDVRLVDDVNKEDLPTHDLKQRNDFTCSSVCQDVPQLRKQTKKPSNTVTFQSLLPAPDYKHDVDKLSTSQPSSSANYQSHQHVDYLHVDIQKTGKTSKSKIQRKYYPYAESSVRKSLIPRPVRFFHGHDSNPKEPALFIPKSLIPRRVMGLPRKYLEKIQYVNPVSEEIETYPLQFGKSQHGNRRVIGKTLHRKEIYADVMGKFGHRPKGTSSTQSKLPQNFRKNKCFGLQTKRVIDPG